MKINFLCIIFVGFATQLCVAYDKVVCYYSSWAQYRSSPMTFLPENIDPWLCTHLIFAFALMNKNKIVPMEPHHEDTESSKGLYSRLIELKKKNTNLKVLLAVGGGSFGSREFSEMVASPNNRNIFIQSTLQYLQKYQFDGLDLDWEYPANGDGSRKEDKQLFTVLCQELKKVFEPYKLLLTAAVNGFKGTVDSAYEVREISKHLDFINLMAYDFHGPWDTTTGFNSPLYTRKNAIGVTAVLSQDFSAKYWIQNGCPKEKLILGLATYGRSFALQFASQNEVGAPIKGAGAVGRFTGNGGILSYYEICEKIKEGSLQPKWSDEQVSSYGVYNGDQWVGYDDAKSMTIKANYIKNNGLGGAMFWTLDLDDFNGKFCGQGNYPLIRSVTQVLSSKV